MLLSRPRNRFFKIFKPCLSFESCSWAGFKSSARGRPKFYLQEPFRSQLKSKVPTPPRRRLWLAICHVRVLEPEQTRLKVEKILAPPAQEQTRFGDAAKILSHSTEG